MMKMKKQTLSFPMQAIILIFYSYNRLKALKFIIPHKKTERSCRRPKGEPSELQNYKKT